jgi:hypothetical protein
MMDARLVWTHRSALERRGVVALARLGGHACPVDCDARAPAYPSEPLVPHDMEILIALPD